MAAILRAEKRIVTRIGSLRAFGNNSIGHLEKVDDGPITRDAILPAKAATTLKQTLPETVLQGQAFVHDLRSTSALGVGDGISNHSAKWLQKELGGQQTSPMEYIQASAPIKVHGLVVASYGSDDPALGCPVEYINLKGTTPDNPAVCKYTGNKYYSDDWKGGGAH
jgi:NADH dehydrogenase (ubiquinone) Fe-S protein 6